MLTCFLCIFWPIYSNNCYSLIAGCVLEVMFWSTLEWLVVFICSSRNFLHDYHNCKVKWSAWMVVEVIFLKLIQCLRTNGRSTTYITFFYLHIVGYNRIVQPNLLDKIVQKFAKAYCSLKTCLLLIEENLWTWAFTGCY